MHNDGAKAEEAGFRWGGEQEAKKYRGYGNRKEGLFGGKKISTS